MAKETETALVVLEPTTALAVFTEADKVDPILAAIKKAVAEFTPDITTAKGRGEIASMAYKVSQSKSYLEGIGKKLADEYKDIPKKIDANRKRIKDELDELRDEVRRPLTEWEDAEKARVQGIKDRIEVIRQHAGMDEDSTMARAAILRVEAVAIEDFEEFAAEAAAVKDKTMMILRNGLELCLKRESEAAELARLRAEAAKREQEDRERKIAEAAAEKAKRDAEEAAAKEKAEIERKAREEREAAERRELELKLAADKAERERLEAIERAEREKLAAVEAERKKQEDAERARLADEARVKADNERRAADLSHRESVHRAIKDAIIEKGVSPAAAITFTSLLTTGSIPFVTIEY